MKKTINFIIISLAPVSLLFAYSVLRAWASHYASRYYDMMPLMITIILGHALIGVAIVFICQKALKITEVVKLPFEFIVGFVLVMIPSLYYFIPIALPPVFVNASGTGVPIASLFAGIYAVLFVILMRRRAKSLKRRKSAQDIQPQK